MSGIFGSKKETQQTSSTVDPWESMPTEVQESYLRDLDFQKEFMDTASGIAEGHAKDPREIAGLTDRELGAFDDMGTATDTANAITSDAMGRLPGELQDFADIDLEALTAGYESGYTDDVVDTTLAGMDREAQRERLRRESQNAAIGGTSNTRSAVADAVSQQLTGMNKAEMEAGLRDKAFTTSAGLGLDAGRFNLDEESAKRGWDMDRANLDLSVADMMERLGSSQYGRDSQLAALKGSLGETERGIEQQTLDAGRSAGTDAYSWLANMFQASNPKSSTPVGQTQTNTAEVEKPSTFSKIAGTAAQVAGIYAGMPSDPVVKSNIRLPDGSALDKLEGLSSKRYRYKEGYGHTRDDTTGLMADEVEESGIEGGVSYDENGIRIVNFYPVLATVVDAVNELKHYRDPGKGLDRSEAA